MSEMQDELTEALAPLGFRRHGRAWRDAEGRTVEMISASHFRLLAPCGETIGHAVVRRTRAAALRAADAALKLADHLVAASRKKGGEEKP